MAENIPRFDTLKTNFSYADAAREPELYKNCYVIWSGMAANIINQKDSTSFDFLVGYENKTTLLGIVKVYCPFASDISNEYPLEVLARVVLEEDAPLKLEVVSVHQNITKNIN